MGDLSLDARSKLAAALIEQSPPGEVNDVINDIRSIIGDDTALMVHAKPALRSHNLTQLHVVEHPAADDLPAHSSLLSEGAILPGSTEAEPERYVDAEGKKSFAFDHVQLIASDYEPYELPEEEEKLRCELAKSLKAYCKNHFSSGVSSVNCSQFPILPPKPEKPAPVVDGEKVDDSKPSDEESAAEPPTEGSDAVTDVVPEQLGSGEEEPAPTPAIGEEKKEEVTEEGGLEQVDEDLEELKVEDQAAEAKDETAEGGAKPESQSHTPQVTEEETAIPDEAKAEDAAVPVPEPRKQERLDNPTYTLEITGMKYNPSNFWTGRWRTRWVVDQAAGQVSGAINVDVHYYEQGNVQLTTSHTASFPCPTETSDSQSIASQIVTTLSKIETNYQLELNDVYGDLGDKAFRSLRRALPVTRQKMDWEKVGGYSLGSDLTKARG